MTCAAGAIDGPTLKYALLAQNFSASRATWCSMPSATASARFEWFNWHDGARSSVGTWSAATGNVFTDTVWFPAPRRPRLAELDCVECAAGEYYDASATVHRARRRHVRSARACARAADCAAGKYAKFEGMDHCVTCPRTRTSHSRAPTRAARAPTAAARRADRDRFGRPHRRARAVRAHGGLLRPRRQLGRRVLKVPRTAQRAATAVALSGQGLLDDTRSAAFLGDHYECPIPELCEGLWHLRSCFTSPRALTAVTPRASTGSRRTFRRLSDGEEGEANGRRLTESATNSSRSRCARGQLGTFCGVCQAGPTRVRAAKAAGCEGQIETTLIAFFALVFVIGGGAFWPAHRARDRRHYAASRALPVRAVPARVPRACTHGPSRSSGRRTRSSA